MQIFPFRSSKQRSRRTEQSRYYYPKERKRVFRLKKKRYENNKLGQPKLPQTFSMDEDYFITLLLRVPKVMRFFFFFSFAPSFLGQNISNSRQILDCNGKYIYSRYFSLFSHSSAFDVSLVSLRFALLLQHRNCRVSFFFYLFRERY